MSLKYLLLPFFYFLATDAFAGEHLWTLKECTDYALSHSLDIKVQQNTCKENEIQLDTYKKSRLPNFGSKIYQDFIDEQSDENFAKVIIANYLLESLYFYNGFNFFYLLASRNKMVGTSDIIRLINRDELSHVVLFRSIVKEIKNDYPEFFSAETIYSMFKTAVEQEITWTEHIIGNRVLGITSQTTEAYTKWLANERLKSLGLEPLFSGFNKNPYKHLERFADTEGEGNVKSNFFEGTVTSYNMSSSIDGWEDF
mgnify:CR=1 FL=1